MGDKKAVLQVSRELLAQVLCLPPSTKILGIKYDIGMSCVELYVEDNELLRDVIEDEFYPRISAILRREEIPSTVTFVEFNYPNN